MWIQWCAFRWKFIAFICLIFQPGAGRHVHPYGHVPIPYDDPKPINSRNVPLDEFSGHDENLPAQMRLRQNAHAYRADKGDNLSGVNFGPVELLKNGSRQLGPGLAQAAQIAQQIQAAQAMAQIVGAQSQAQITQHTSAAAIQAAQAQAQIQQAYLNLANAQQTQAAQLAAQQAAANRPPEAPQGLGSLISSLASGIGMSGLLPLLGLAIGAAIFVLIAGFLVTRLTVSEVRRSRLVNRYEQDEDTLQSIYSIAQRYRPCNIRDSATIFRDFGGKGGKRRTRCRHLYGSGGGTYGSGSGHDIFSHEHDDDFGILNFFGLGDGDYGGGGFGFGGKRRRRKHKFGGGGYGGGYGGDLFDYGFGDGDNHLFHRADLIPSESQSEAQAQLQEISDTTWYEDILLGLGTLLLEPFGLN